ncbi:hypothetical protein [Atopobacter phocae]|nr:hypothetical protein [Atopobacter phocae]
MKNKFLRWIKIISVCMSVFIMSACHLISSPEEIKAIPMSEK